jgi:Cu-processing system permease protein
MKLGSITILARTTMLENARKHVFHVLMIATLTVICASTLISFFTLGVQIKILKDLCMTSILLCGGVLGIALAASGVPNDIEQKTLYPLMARPITRAEYILGKYFGTLATVYVGLLVLSGAFLTILFSHGAEPDMLFCAAIAFAFLEVAVVTAIAVWLSTSFSPAVAGMLAFLFYICGTIKIGYFAGMLERMQNPVAKALAGIFYHFLPNLECFNFKDALVHQIGIPVKYLALVGVYGVAYTVFALVLATALFSRREL